MDRLRRALLAMCGLVGIALLNPAAALPSTVTLSCQTYIYWDPPDAPVQEYQYVFQFECGEDQAGTACYYAAAAPYDYRYWMFDCTTLQNTGQCDSGGCRVS